MAHFRHTARKNFDARPRTWSLVGVYYEHQREEGEVLVEFIVHFGTFWNSVHRPGVTNYDSIVRLIGHLPELWKEWAEATAKHFLWRRHQSCDLCGDMKGFIKAMVNGLLDHPEGPPLAFTVPPPPDVLELPPWTFLKRCSERRDEGGSSRPPKGKKARTEIEDSDDSDKEEEAEDYHFEAEEETEDHHTKDAEEEEPHKVGEPRSETPELGETEFVPPPLVRSPPEIPHPPPRPASENLRIVRCMRMLQDIRRHSNKRK